ncbi:uncharacterized protein BXZ73DRAFT_99900 [Epithele typhae]|uniref:uncharacterized protein n=1 Tax=Epithele typhae TaxID=378194 RepID=UPI0020075486|nr:uncharacterized protein BXZ73DRAFT_99900 [Epithele typhae]KAH9938842.1 hypothetical protein BXZ73DRAFT_99900 [Epithele typhae]
MDSSSASPPAVPAVDSTLGALLICTSIAMLMYGLLIHQTFQYYRMFTEEKLYLKLWVAFVFITETYTIVVALEETIIQLLPPIATFTPVAVEIFFMRRVWLLGRQYRPLVAVAFAFVVSFYAGLTGRLSFSFQGCYIAISVVGYTAPDPLEWLRRGARLAGIGSVLLEVGDLITTSVLVYVLFSSRSEIRRTNSIIDLLIKYTVTTGMLCGLSLIISIVFAFLYPNTMIWIASDVFISKLQANVFVATLNARRGLSNEFSHVTPSVSKPPLVSFPSGRSMGASNTIDATRYELKAIAGGPHRATSDVYGSETAFGADSKV